MEYIIRIERPQDYKAVETLTREAFWNLYVPGCNEHYLLHRLRSSPGFLPELSLVAEWEGAVLGHIAFTRGRLVREGDSPLEVFSFGPLSVWPRLQGKGIGGALVRRGLKDAREMGCTAVCIYGDPRYYSRFGFRCAEKYDIRTADGKFAAALLALELVPGVLSQGAGRFVEDPAFDVDMSDFDVYDSGFEPKERLETESQRVFSVIAGLRY